MDLAENFPGSYPKPPIAHARRNVSPGRGAQATSFGHATLPYQEVSDNREHLNTLPSKLKAIEIKIIHHAAQYYRVKKDEVRRYQVLRKDKDPDQVRDRLADHPQLALNDALLDLHQLFPELRRVLTDRTSMPESQKRRAFFVLIRNSLIHIKNLINCQLKQLELFRRLEAELRRKSSAPSILTNGKHLQPWLAWCRPKIAPRGVPTHHLPPGLQMTFAQLIPLNGIAILEHWRREVHGVVSAIATGNGMQPHLFRQLRPTTLSIIAIKTFRRDGRFALASTAIRTPGLHQHPIAFGKQGQIAEMGTFMAMLSNDVVGLLARWSCIVSTCVHSEDVLAGLDSETEHEIDAKLFLA